MSSKREELRNASSVLAGVHHRCILLEALVSACALVLGWLWRIALFHLKKMFHVSVCTFLKGPFSRGTEESPRSRSNFERYLMAPVLRTTRETTSRTGNVPIPFFRAVLENTVIIVMGASAGPWKKMKNLLTKRTQTRDNPAKGQRLAWFYGFVSDLRTR